MNTKLTLSIDKNIIKKAKKYAKTRNKSISKIVENYLKNVSEDYKDVQLSPIVNELAGSIKNSELDLNEEYTEYLFNKYK